MTANQAYFASRLPGRIRIRERALRDASRHQALAAELAKLDGVLSVEGSVAVGSLLVTYDVARAALEAMETAIAAKVEAVLGPAPVEPAASPERRRQPMMRRLNTFSKLGMLASLAGSMAAIGVSKRLHAGAGAVYLAMMLVHVGVHRHRLFK